MELLAKIAFVIYTIILLSGAWGAVTAKSLVRALLGLILSLFGVAGMYLLLNAPFVALMQILIYVGAVVILIFFAIMLTKTPSGGEEHKPKSTRKYLAALLMGLAPASALGWLCIKHPAQTTKTPELTDIAQLGQGLMEPYLLAFELISVVLFVAMSAAVLLGFERRQGR
jgi:NADH-quinone oxidoreductase subunit J